MDKQKLRDIMLGKVAPYLIRELDIQSCVTVSIAACEVLKEFGVEASPATCYTIYGNEKWVELIRKHGPKKLRDMCVSGEAPMDAWGVGIGVPVEEVRLQLDKEAQKHNELHCVIYLPKEGKEGEIIDLTAGQASRPERDMFVGPMWFALDKIELPVIEFGFRDQWENVDPTFFKENAEKIQGEIKPVLRKMIGKAFTKEGSNESR